MTSEPLVTIVTPSFNHARFIVETIESVLSQDYPNIEYIVMDAASTDDTAEVVRPYLDRLTFISEPDRGQSHAINKGFAMARGEIVAWLNSDDVFLPGAISKAVRAFRTNPAAGVVYGEGYQIDIDGNVKSRFPHTQRFDLWRLVHMSDYILQQTVFFRKEALDAVGEIREDLFYTMDWDILIRLAKRFDFIYVPEFLGSLREYETAKTFSGGIKRAKEIREMLRGHTSKRLPEGYVVYGLDAYSQAWSASIKQWPSVFEGLKGPVERLMIKICHRILGRVATQGQGMYADRWLSKKARFMLRCGSGHVVFKGLLPDVPQLHGQQMTITCRGRICAQKHIGPGEFEMRFDAPPEASDSALTYEVIASKTFVPAEQSKSADTRALSVLYRDFYWADRVRLREVRQSQA